MVEIYHITHINNLSKIIEMGGLCSDNEIVQNGLSPIQVAHSHIKERRAKKVVPLGVGGTLADYVPFYFAPRSPMLYAIHTGFVEGYNGNQTNILHLITTSDIVVDAGEVFAFSDGHAEMAISNFFDDATQFDKIDWNIMEKRIWRDTVEDGDRKRRRQAEFLVYKFFSWNYVTQIGVISQKLAEDVGEILETTLHQPEILVRPGWYY